MLLPQKKVKQKAGENDSVGLSVPCYENSGSEDTFAEESDENNAVSTEEGGESTGEEQWGAGSQSENEVVAQAIR